MAKKPAKPKMGRPALPKGEKAERITITLTPDIIRMLWAIGTLKKETRSGTIARLTKEEHDQLF
jgi:hypothetical protein